MKKLIILSVLLFANSCVGRYVKYDSETKKTYKNNSPISNKKPKNKIIYQGKYKSFIKSINPNLNDRAVEIIINEVKQQTKIYNIDPKWIFSLIARESSFRANAVSSSGAIGLGQMLRATAKDMGVNNPFDAKENIKGTVKYINYLIKYWDGDIDLAIASYKIGMGTVGNILKKGNSFSKATKGYISDIKSYYSKI